MSASEIEQKNVLFERLLTAVHSSCGVMYGYVPRYLTLDNSGVISDVMDER